MIDRIRQQYRRHQDISKVAEDILCFYSDEPDYGAVPVTAIARRLRIAVKNIKIDNKLMAMLLVGDSVKQKFGSKRVILLNERLSYEYKRFTLARELAHYIFDYQPSVTEFSSRIYAYSDKKELTAEENRAIEFSVALLLEAKAFQAEYAKVGELAYLDRVRYLTDTFKVPESFVNRRIDELELL